MTNTLARYEGELSEISGLTTPSALPRAARYLADLVADPPFLASKVLLEEAEGAEDWYVASRHVGEDDAYTLEVFVWPTGTGTRIHDHASWGACACAVGSVLEERYDRVDDGSRPGNARLKKAWQLWWSQADGASTVLPAGGGIHRVSNPRSRTAVSVHLYGPRREAFEGRDYDPERDHVCDRR